MSNQNLSNQSRRSFLKGAAYTSILSIGGISGLAFADSSNSTSLSKAKPLTDSSISIMQQQMLDKETVTLINHSDSPVLLDSHKPIHLEQVNGSLVVKVNQKDSDAFCGLVQISPRERITFDITTLRADFTNSDIFPIPTLAGNDVLLTSDHGAFNKVVAVS
ncbi:MAG: hypothetical protein V7749_08915 [Cocleimonas sp.]